MINAITTNLVTPNIIESYDFYANKLDFTVLFSVDYNGETSMEVDNKTVFIAIWNPENPDNMLFLQDLKSYEEDLWISATKAWESNLYISIDNIDDYIKICEENNIKILMWPRDTFYGTKEILIKDNLWNNLVLSEMIDTPE